ncbi:MAG: hypothetical protein SWJ54_19785, partial [Cyanobacteriota bacterium]|nr:hypothetical protein [Cyanobacteriota bacterium]
SNWLGVNQKVYLHLKQALLSNVRRQTLIAVCDDLQFRQTMLTQLNAELLKPQNSQASLGQSKGRTSSPTHWVNLILDRDNPNLITQIEQWFAENASRKSLASGSVGFQILGIEQLMRQPGAIQWSFLYHLRNLKNELAPLEFSLLLWIPTPWLRCIEQSAPEFWCWRTGVFEFEGEPTPVTSLIQTNETPKKIQSAANVVLAEDKFTSEVDENPEKENHTVAITRTSPAKKQSQETAPKPANLTQTLHKIQQLQHRRIAPQKLTRAYRILSERVRQQMQRGLVSPEQIQLAIQAYETAWQHIENSTHPLLNASEIVDWLNDLGTLYWMRFHQEKRGKIAIALERTGLHPIADIVIYLEQSILFYQQALMRVNPDQEASTCARLQKNLGAAYADLAKIREPIENLQQSVEAYREATRFFQIVNAQSSNREQTQKLALSYASALNNLATAHWSLAQYSQPSRHLQAAITAYTQASHYYPSEQFPQELGMIQANIGTAYWNLAQHAPEDKWLHHAIKAYQKALLYRTPNTDVAACAATQNNLGIAYWHLANRYQDSEIRARFLRRAIASYEMALSLVEQLSPTQLNFDSLATHNNLGLAYYQLAKDQHLDLSSTDRVAHFEAALNHHLQADDQQQTLDPAAKAVKSGHHQITLGYVIQAIRAIYNESGLAGQNQALSQIPAHLLSEVLRSL